MIAAKRSTVWPGGVWHPPQRHQQGEHRALECNQGKRDDALAVESMTTPPHGFATGASGQAASGLKGPAG